jgi:outer membrane autotransporter protein
LYVDASVWGNFGTGKVTRDLGLVDRIAKSSYDPNEIRFNIDAGYRFVLDNNIGLTPYVDLSYRNSKIDSVAEVGAGGLGYNLTNLGGSSVKPSFGVTLDSEWSLSGEMRIRPLVGFGIEFQPKADDVVAQFQGGGDSFNIESGYRNEVAFKPEVGFDLVLDKNLSLQLSYLGAIGKNGSTNGGWFRLRGNW